MYWLLLLILPYFFGLDNRRLCCFAFYIAKKSFHVISVQQCCSSMWVYIYLLIKLSPHITVKELGFFTQY